MNTPTMIRPDSRLLPVLLMFLLVPALVQAQQVARGAAPGNETYLARTVTVTVIAPDPDTASDLIGAWAERSGGYFIVKTTERILLRVPFGKVPELRGYLASIAEQLVDYSERAQDLREELSLLSAGIESRERILTQNLKLLDRADVAGTLAVEQEVARLLQEIEALKGRQRKLGTDRQFSLVDISLRFLKPELPDDTSSSFPWINTVDFYRFMEGY